MPAEKLTIQLTDDQELQIKNTTGRSIKEVAIDLRPTGLALDADVDRIGGSNLIVNYKEV